MEIEDIENIELLKKHIEYLQHDPVVKSFLDENIVKLGDPILERYLRYVNRLEDIENINTKRH